MSFRQGLLVSALALALAGCTGTTMPNTGATGVFVQPTAATLVVGDTLRITAFMSPTDLVPGGVGAVQWRSSNAGVANVAAGLVTGMSAGQASITASAGQYSGSAQIRVLAP